MPELKDCSCVKRKAGPCYHCKLAWEKWHQAVKEHNEEVRKHEMNRPE